MPRKPYQPKGLLLTSAVMASMRNTAFGKDAQLHIFKTLDRSERMRNDQALLDAAEAKRQRKALKRKGESKMNQKRMENITCPFCRARHPAIIPCAKAARIANDTKIERDRIKKETTLREEVSDKGDSNAD